jgi:hypothetical protein
MTTSDHRVERFHVEQLPDRLPLNARAEGGPRSMTSYLLLPRPADVGKTVILPLGFVVGSLLSTAPSGHTIVRALMVWFAIEYLTYQARYQWNDIRGFWSDQLHPDCDARGRLPGPAERGQAHIALSAKVAVARVLAAVLLVVVARVGVVFLFSIVAVFAVAVIYEWVRTRAGAQGPGERPATACVALWVVSGGGYCVRGLTGLMLATGTQVSLVGLILAGIACWSAGIVFVTTRWAVESIPFVTRRDGRLHWVASPDAGRGHLLALAHWLPRDAEAAPDELRTWRMLWVRRPWHAPWNVALLVALTSAWLGGVALTTTTVTGIAGAAASAAAVLAGWALITLRPRLSTGVTAVVVLLAAAVAVCGTPAPSALCVVVCIVYLTSTHQCLSDVGKLYRRWSQPVIAAVAAVRAGKLSTASATTVPAAVVDRARRT